jgi:putative pyruvate formate lyase activating enzyme
MFRPAYLETLNQGLFPGKVADAMEMLRSCNVCPRGCAINRLAEETGFCGIGSKAVVSSWGAHFGEETCLVGSGGSGTIFFTSCNLKCVFCQNYEISHLMEGQEVTTRRLADVMLELQQEGCPNINFVTPSHLVPQIINAVFLAAESGLRVPLVYNTGGYDSLETLGLLDGIIDIYMPDIKFMDSEISRRLMSAPDYPEVVKAVIKEMHRQVGDLQIAPSGVATRGLLIRHLVMPEDLAGTREAMRFISKEISQDTYVNIMDQYRPCGRAFEHPDINRTVTREEYATAIDVAIEEGVTRLDNRVAARLRFW